VIGEPKTVLMVGKKKGKKKKHERKGGKIPILEKKNLDEER